MSQKYAPDVRTVEYWAQRWTDGKIGWHQEAVDPELAAHSELLLPPSSLYRVFVPLCGRSLDLLWLYSKGHTVVGVEAVESVVQQFFEEHSIPYTTSQLAWATQYQSKDQRLTLYVCDFFSVDVAALGTFDAVFDRAAFVAVNVCDRQRYASVVKQLLRSSYRYLLCTVEYEANETYSGPPCSVSLPEVEALFGVSAKEVGCRDTSERYVHLLEGRPVVTKAVFFSGSS